MVVSASIATLASATLQPAAAGSLNTSSGFASSAFAFSTAAFWSSVRRGVLEADDVHAGHLQLHGDAFVLDRDVERAVAVHVGAELAMLLLGAQGRGQGDGRQRGDEMKCPHSVLSSFGKRAI